jgi:hypothetical protein
MALVVGDITGHGIGAAADTALVRGMVSALLHSGVATSDVFSETVRCPQPTQRTQSTSLPEPSLSRDVGRLLPRDAPADSPGRWNRSPGMRR